MNVSIGLLGCGTVGAGVFELSARRAAKVELLTGLRPVIRRVLVRDLDKERQVSVERSMLTTDFRDIIEDEQIKVIVETIGGIEPARTFILNALRAGKHVVTANKDLIAVHGPEILETAEQFHVSVMYEAAVGGAIPLIRPLKESLTANDISELRGIVNGTTNYMLTRMTQLGLSYDEALAEAQALGYAERDPTSDVDGLDAARKLTILASIAFHTLVRLDDVRVQGIRSVTAADIRYADELGTVIKLLAVGREQNGSLRLEVRPSMVSKNHPLAHVSESYNALFVSGDAAGDLMFFGQGAGSLPTASAVLGDVIQTLRDIKMGHSGKWDRLYTAHKPVEQDPAELLKYYLRLTVIDQPGVFSDIANLFSDDNVSMETVIQKKAVKGKAEIVVVTHEVTRRQVHHLADRLNELQSVDKVHMLMPVELSVDT